MLSERSHPYFLTPRSSNPSAPLFVYLPGVNEIAKELMSIQTASLELAFDVRCFVIPPDNLLSWDEMTDQVVSLTQMELEKTPRSSVYLCGDSFGGCLALKILEKFPQLFSQIILINSASSFHRVPWLNLGSRLFPYTPTFLYQMSSFMALPFLAHLKLLSSAARLGLLNSIRSASVKTTSQRLCLMREFKIDEEKLSQITQSILLIASGDDRLLPSRAEAQRLAKIFSNTQMKILPHNGHACLVETDVNFYEILKTENFIVT